MYGILFSLIFFVALAVAMLLGALKAKKKVWQFSVIRMVQTIVSALLGALISWAVSDALAGFMVSKTNGDLGELIKQVPSAHDAFSAVIAMLVAPLIFLPVYIIVRLFSRIFTKMLTRLLVKLTSRKKNKKEKKDELETLENPTGSAYFNKLYSEDDTPVAPITTKKKSEFSRGKSNAISALCGAVCGFITFCVIMIPAVGTLGVVADVASLPLHTAADASESGEVAMIADVVDGLSSNAGTFTVKMVGGGLVYDMMTTFDVSGQKATLRKEADTVKSFANALVISADEKASVEEKAETVREISTAFSKSTILPTLISEITSAANEDWRDGRDFYGMDMPAKGSSVEPVVRSMVTLFAESDRDTIKEDVHTIVDIVAILIEDEAMDDFGSDPISVFEHEETTTRVFKDLLDNERLCVLADGFSDMGISLLMESLNVPAEIDPLYEQFLAELENIHHGDKDSFVESYADLFDTYGLEVEADQIEALADATLAGGDAKAWVKDHLVAGKADFMAKTRLVSISIITKETHPVTDTAKEAQALAHVFSGVSTVMRDMESDNGVKNMLRDLGPVLDAMSATETIGAEETGNILKAILQSDSVHDQVGLSVLEAVNTAESIKVNSAARGYADMMNSLAHIVEVMESVSDDSTSTHEAVKELLADLTPESAEVISSLATPGVVQNYGVGKRPSVPVSDMIGNTFSNLAEAKKNGMSDEEYDKESAAVSDMMNVLMSAGSAGKAFGEGSRTGTSAETFVGNMMNSQVMSETVVDAVYGEGDTPTQDPLLTETHIADEEKNELVQALNAQYGASDKSEEAQKEIIAIGALFNVEVGIVDGVVVTADTPALLPA